MLDAGARHQDIGSEVTGNGSLARSSALLPSKLDCLREKAERLVRAALVVVREPGLRRFYSFLLRLLVSSFLFLSLRLLPSFSLSLALVSSFLSQDTVSKRRGNAAGMPPANPLPPPTMCIPVQPTTLIPGPDCTRRKPGSILSVRQGRSRTCPLSSEK